MTANVAVVVVAIGGAALAASSSPLRAQPAAARSVLDGVFTDGQAKRGETLYGQSCSSCHGPALAGDDEAPALTGGAFISNWSGTTVGDLADRVRLTMPANDPGKLSRQASVDILAYVFSVNKFPAGDKELPREPEMLSQIQIQPPKP